MQKSSGPFTLHNPTQALVAGFTVLIFLGFLVSGLRGIDAALKRSTLTCNRIASRQVDCELQSSGITGTKTTPVSPLQAVEIETQTSTVDSGQSYRVVLVTPHQKIPLLTEFYGQSRVLKKANQIDAFVGNPNQKSFVIQQRGQWYSFVLGLPFVFIGGGGALCVLQEAWASISPRRR